MSELNTFRLNGTEYDFGGSGTGISEDFKQALHDILEKVAYIDENGQDYLDSLDSAMWPPADLVSISCVYTQSGAVYTTDTLDSLKEDLVVIAHMNDSTTRIVTTYTLSGTLTVGTSTITVSYGGKTTTFNVIVSEVALYPLPDMANRVVSGDITLSISDGKTIDLKTTANSRNCFVYGGSGVTRDSQDDRTTLYFELPVGASYEIKIKNISYVGNTSTSNNFAVALRDSSATSYATTGSIPISSTGDGTLEDVIVSGTLDTQNEVAIVCVVFFVYRAITLHFDYEVIINGVKYI